MSWKFWRKEKPLKQLDPHMLAVVMLQRMVEHETPFNRWRDEENPIPERADAFVELAVNVYQLSIFLDLLERKFGADVTAVVRSNLITLMTTGSPKISGFFDAVRIGRAMPEREPFFAHEPACQVDCNVAKAFLSQAAEPEEEKTALYPKLGQSLTLGRISAATAFGPVVEDLDFRPESTFGFRQPKEIPISWSEAPGCFERQLQRRYNNALFPLARRRITTGDVIEGQSRDQADLEALRTDCQTFFNEVTTDEKQKVSFKDVTKWRDKAEGLIVRAAGMGDIANPHREALTKVYDIVIKSMRDGCPPEHKSQLEEAIEGSDTYLKTWSNHFVAQFTRKDTPIAPDDLIPSLLVEDVETVRLMAATIRDENRRGLVEGAVVLLENAKREGYIVPNSEEKLRALSDTRFRWTQFDKDD